MQQSEYTLDQLNATILNMKDGSKMAKVVIYLESPEETQIGVYHANTLQEVRNLLNQGYTLILEDDQPDNVIPDHTIAVTLPDGFQYIYKGILHTVIQVRTAEDDEGWDVVAHNQLVINESPTKDFLVRMSPNTINGSWNGITRFIIDSVTPSEFIAYIISRKDSLVKDARLRGLYESSHNVHLLGDLNAELSLREEKHLGVTTDHHLSISFIVDNWLTIVNLSENNSTNKDWMDAITISNYDLLSVGTSRLQDESVTLPKIFKYGVLPTDIFRIDVTSTFSMAGCGLGGVVVQGQNNNFFTYDSSHSHCPYRLGRFYDSSFPKVLAFMPVTPVIENDAHEYSVASSFVHFNDDGITVQAIIQLSDSKYSALYNEGKRYLKIIASGDIYNHGIDGQTIYFALNKIVFVNFNISKNTLNQGYEQHIVISLNIDSTATNS